MDQYDKELGEGFEFELTIKKGDTVIKTETLVTGKDSTVEVTDMPIGEIAEDGSIIYYTFELRETKIPAAFVKEYGVPSNRYINFGDEEKNTVYTWQYDVDGSMEAEVTFHVWSIRNTILGIEENNMAMGSVFMLLAAMAMFLAAFINKKSPVKAKKK